MKHKHLLIAGLFLSTNFYFAQQKPTEKETKIDEVTIVKTKKAVEQKADRTIFDFSEQAHLNSGTVMDGVKKLPGLVVTDIAGMMYQGKLLDVYMDGRPLNITSNELNSFLEGMPANAVERIEIITQPGAEFPATSGGAILNIITSKTARNYLTATYSGNYSFTNYDKFRQRTNNSLSLNSRNKIFAWQLNIGQNYREGMMNGTIDDFSGTFTDFYRRGYFAKAGMTFELGNDRLLLNYDVYHNNNDSYTLSHGKYNGNTFQSSDLANSLNLRNEAVATYQKRFDDKNKKLDFKLSYTSANSDFDQQNFNINQNVLQNDSDLNNVTFKVDYSEPVKILDEGKISFGGLYEKQNFQTSSKGIQNLDYQRQTASSYAEIQAKLKQFDFTLGTRAEDYDISGYAGNTALTPFKKFKLFPNASVQYNFMKQVYFALNYNKKINLPSISALNPNNTTYQNPNSVSTGNPNLQPTIFDNYEAKISAFDYAFIGYSVSHAKNQLAQMVTRNGDIITNKQMNIPEMNIRNFNVGLPIPFMIFTKPLSEIMKFNFNPDKINFLYIYAANQKHVIPNLDTKSFWMFNLMSQLILPKDIKLTANYFYIQPNASYFYFVSEKPIGNSVDLTISKKFMKDRLSVSVFANDIFNGQQMAFRSVETPNVRLSNKNDSRSFGFSLNYKIPTKNKLAKEAPNMLNQEKKDDSGGILPQGNNQ